MSLDKMYKKDAEDAKNQAACICWEFTSLSAKIKQSNRFGYRKLANNAWPSKTHAQWQESGNSPWQCTIFNSFFYKWGGWLMKGKTLFKAWLVRSRMKKAPGSHAVYGGEKVNTRLSVCSESSYYGRSPQGPGSLCCTPSRSLSQGS